MSKRFVGSGMTSPRTRDRMLRRLQQDGVKSPAVLEAMRAVPRHLFVDEALSSRAYDDTALPIGHGQTISQPYIVARMTEALFEGGPLRRVLEVGTGSGYQTAILASLVEQVYSVERVEALMRLARSRFMLIGIRNIRLKHTDGHWGWPDYAPFEGIMVTAAPREIPKELLQQLADGGRLVIPVGGFHAQRLQRVTRRGNQFDVEDLEAVKFVPLRIGNASA